MNIICVEDSRTIQILVENIVVNLNQRYTSVSTGGELIEACSKEKFDLIISGYELADCNAEMLITKLRQQKEYNDTPVWVLTSKVLDADIIFSLPFTTFFQKGKIIVLHTELSELLGITTNTLPLLGEKLLLVDDSKISRMIATRMLMKLGADIEEACDGKEALEMMLANQYTLVLMDCEMPIMDGLQTSQAYREANPSSKLPIIALSGHSAAYKQMIIDAGMNYLITKPVEMHKIIHALNVLKHDANKP